MREKHSEETLSTPKYAEAREKAKSIELQATEIQLLNRAGFLFQAGFQALVLHFDSLELIFVEERSNKS